jgi:iron complex transport system substrate-binding protein
VTRIISLLPSATEWVFQLGLGEWLVGVSHECDYPGAVKRLPRVTRSRVDPRLPSSQIDAAVREHSQTQTSLYELDEALVRSLQPDLILTQSLCNVCAVSERDVLRSVADLSKGCRLLNLSAQTFEQVLEDAELLTEATGSQAESLQAIATLRGRMDQVRRHSQRARRPSMSLLEWLDPIYGGGHWNPDLIRLAGGDDPIGAPGKPSRQIDPHELLAANPDILLVAGCGLSEARTRAELANLEQIPGWSNLRAVRNSQVHVFDGSAFFNRPGPRLVDALEQVAQLVSLWSE